MDEIVLWRSNESRNLGFVGIADDEGDAGEGGEFFGCALGITAGYEDFGGRVLSVNFADGVAGLGVGGGSDGAGVYDDEFRALR